MRDEKFSCKSSKCPSKRKFNCRRYFQGGTCFPVDPYDVDNKKCNEFIPLKKTDPPGLKL